MTENQIYQFNLYGCRIFRLDAFCRHLQCFSSVSIVSHLTETNYYISLESLPKLSIMADIGRLVFYRNITKAEQLFLNYNFGSYGYSVN